MEAMVFEAVWQLMCEYGDDYWYIDAEGEEHDAVCDHCPMRDRCHEDGVYWGCPHWEDDMGEDL